MDVLIIFIRISITLSFFILAAGGPWALWKLSRFIRSYKTAHEELKERVAKLEHWRNVQEMK